MASPPTGLQTVLVDTDVLSFIFKADPKAELYKPEIEGKIAALSFQTVAESLQGAYRQGWGEKRLESLRAEIRRYLIVPFDWAMVEHFAQIRAERWKVGREIKVADCWIAATARHLGVPIVTHNRRDFAGTSGLTVISHAP